MSEQLQLRRGTAAQVAAFTPAQGETVVDTNYFRLYVGDGATAGGWAAARAQRTAVSNAGYTALGTDRIVAYTTLSAAQTVTLPAAASFPPGERLMVIDESGACSTTNTITVTAAGTDKINGAASVPISLAFGFLALESNGSNAWAITDSFMAAQAPHGAGIQFAVLEITSGTLSGALVTLSNVIPNNCFILSVGMYVTTTVTGPSTNFLIGWNGPGGSTSTFGTIGSGSFAAGSTNYGLTPPTATYSGPYNITLTPTGGNFTAGAVRLSIHLMYCSPSSS